VTKPNDLLFGDAGNDTFVFAEGSGYDTIADFEIGDDTIDISDFGFESFDQLNLVEQNNAVFLFIDENTSIELTGITDVNQLSATDFIFADAPDEDETVPSDGGVFSGTNGDDVIVGSAGDDVITASAGEDLIDGGAGDDNIRAGAGDDNVAGGAGDDIINGRDGNDYLTGDAGADTFLFEQNSGFDTIADFESGADRIDVSDFGITSFDDLNLVDQGTSVAVYLDENTSAELLGIGNVNQLSEDDFIFANDSDDDVVVPVTPVAPQTPADNVIVGTDGVDTLTGSNNADTIDGGRGRDSILGNGGDDNLNGGNGADDVRGGAGDDFVAGGNGNDDLYGGAGTDVLSGGNGNDTFVITVDTGVDMIADFEAGFDQIDLSAFDFDSFNDLNIIEQNNSVFILIDDDTSVELSNIDDADDLSATDFIL